MAERPVVKLNVGGMFYTTTRQNLCQYRECILGQIVTGKLSCPRDERGSYFIDRDGPIFRHVLNYLRTGRLILPQGFKELSLLKEESRYYSIEPLYRDIENFEKMRRRRYRNRKRRNNMQNGERGNDDEFSDGSNEWFEDEIEVASPIDFL